MFGPHDRLFTFLQLALDFLDPLIRVLSRSPELISHSPWQSIPYNLCIA
jgi:hypothetical protein